MQELQMVYKGPNGGANYRPQTVILSSKANSDGWAEYTDIAAIISIINEIPMNHFTSQTGVHGLSGTAQVVGTSSTQTLTNKLIELDTQNNTNNIIGIKDKHIASNQKINGSKLDLKSINVSDLNGVDELKDGMQQEIITISGSSYSLLPQNVKDTVLVFQPSGSSTQTLILPDPSSIPTTLKSQCIVVMNSNPSGTIKVIGFGSRGLNNVSTYAEFSIPPQRSAIFTTGYNANSRNTWYETGNMLLVNGKLQANDQRTNIAATPYSVTQNIESEMLRGTQFISSGYNGSLGCYTVVTGTYNGRTVRLSTIGQINGIISSIRTQRFDPDTGQLISDDTDPFSVDGDMIPIQRTIR